MIIGIAGTNGAGKGAIVQYLEQEGFKHYSARALFVEELQKRGAPLDRSSMRALANEWRAAYGPAHNIQALYERAAAKGGDAVIESVRALGEVKFLKAQGAKLLAVDADRHLRYERVVKRGSETDRVDFDTWVEEEEREWHNTAEHDMNVPAVMAQADYTIMNNGSVEELHQSINAILAAIRR